MSPFLKKHAFCKGKSILSGFSRLQNALPGDIRQELGANLLKDFFCWNLSRVLKLTKTPKSYKTINWDEVQPQIAGNTVDGRNPANQLIWRIYHFLQGLSISSGAGFLPSTVVLMRFDAIRRHPLFSCVFVSLSCSRPCHEEKKWMQFQTTSKQRPTAIFFDSFKPIDLLCRHCFPRIHNGHEFCQTSYWKRKRVRRRQAWRDIMTSSKTQYYFLDTWWFARCTTQPWCEWWSGLKLANQSREQRPLLVKQSMPHQKNNATYSEDHRNSFRYGNIRL